MAATRGETRDWAPAAKAASDACGRPGGRSGEETPGLGGDLSYGSPTSSVKWVSSRSALALLDGEPSWVRYAVGSECGAAVAEAMARILSLLPLGRRLRGSTGSWDVSRPALGLEDALGCVGAEFDAVEGLETTAEADTWTAVACVSCSGGRFCAVASCVAMSCPMVEGCGVAVSLDPSSSPSRATDELRATAVFLTALTTH